MTTVFRHAALAAALVALAACSGKEDDADDAKATATVKTAAVQAADVPETLTAYGTAEAAPSGEETLTAPVEAVVTGVRVSPGADIEAGQPLVDLKPSPATAAELIKAAADQEVATKALARAERLRASGLDSDADVEQARAAAATAAEAQRSLTARIGAAMTVRAQHKGVVEVLTATPGDLVAAGAALGKIGASGAVQVRLGLEPSDVAKIRPGQAVTLRAVGGGALASGTVSSVQSRIDPQTRLAGAIVEAHGALTLGQAVQGDIVLHTVHAPTAPKAAIVYDQDQPAVFVVSGGTAHRRVVALGPAQGDTVAVTAGLVPGDRIVTEGAASLDDGMAVGEAGAAKPADTDDR
jgi:RND family efflux transporter MFP subunit